MFLLFCAVARSDDGILLTTSGSGFTPVTLIPNRTAKIDLAGRTAVILDAEPDSFIFTVTTDGTRYPSLVRPFPGKYVMVSGDILQLEAASVKTQLFLWILPPKTCSLSSSALTAEHSLSLRTKTSRHPENVCIFTQSTFSKASIDVLVKSADKHTKVEFFGAEGTSLQSCKLGKVCKTSSQSPFFLRIVGNPNKTLKVKINYDVDSPGSGINYCYFNPIPQLVKGMFQQWVQFLGGVDIACKSRAVDALEALEVLGIGFLVVFTVVIFLQCTELVDFVELIYPDPEKKRFASLKKDPYAGVVAEPGRDTV
jgi:hypothetical protein